MNRLVSIAFGACLAFALPSEAEVKARQKKPPLPDRVPAIPGEKTTNVLPVAQPVPAIDKQEVRYRQLLVIYLSNIERLHETQREEKLRAYRERVQRLAEEAANLEKVEKETLVELRDEAARRPQGKLDFDGERLENQAGVMLPNSAASGRIFTNLYDSGLLETKNMLSRLLDDAQLLSKEWIALVERIAKDSPQGTAQWRNCVCVLYRAGVSRDLYGKVLRRLAMEDEDVRALETVFFDIDATTGEIVRQVSNDNLELLQRLVDKSASPGIRVTCAHYAAEVRDFTLAEKLCSELLSRGYRGAGTSGSVFPEDWPLMRARSAAILLMFWGIRNEAAFKHIFDVAGTETREIAEHGDLEGKTGWVSVMSYSCSAMEIRQARSLLATVEE